VEAVHLLNSLILYREVYLQHWRHQQRFLLILLPSRLLGLLPALPLNMDTVKFHLMKSHIVSQQVVPTRQWRKLLISFMSRRQKFLDIHQQIFFGLSDQPINSELEQEMMLILIFWLLRCPQQLLPLQFWHWPQKVSLQLLFNGHLLQIRKTLEIIHSNTITYNGVLAQFSQPSLILLMQDLQRLLLSIEHLILTMELHGTTLE